MLPICVWCKKVRNDQNYWQSVEVYVAEHADARFTHGICPPCRQILMKGERERRGRGAGDDQALRGGAPPP